MITGLLVVFALPPAQSGFPGREGSAPTSGLTDLVAGTLVQAAETSIHEPWEDTGEVPATAGTSAATAIPPEQASTVPSAPSPPPAYHPDPGTYKVPIVMYHDIGSPAAGLTVTPDMLEMQMVALESAGYQAVSMDAVLLAMRGEEVPLPARPVAITFDDAYVAVFTKAYPILKKHGFTATLYVITGMVQKSGYLDWDQVRALEAGGWTIGSHTVRHLDLRSLKGKSLEDELVLARNVLRENTGQPILSFCYPSGRFDDSVVQAVKAAGYCGAVTTNPGTATLLDAPFTLKRLRVDGREGLSLFKSRLSIP